MNIAWFVLAYLGIGVLFLLVYVLAVKPEANDTALGLTALFWPIVLLVDVVLAIATQIGAAGRLLSARFSPSQRES